MKRNSPDEIGNMSILLTSNLPSNMRLAHTKWITSVPNNSHIQTVRGKRNRKNIRDKKNRGRKDIKNRKDKGMAVRTCDPDSNNKDCESHGDNEPCYDPTQVRNIRHVYLIAIIVWIILVLVYQLVPPQDLIELAILLIPIFVFTISFFSIPNITAKVESYMFKANLLTLGLIVVLPLINWAHSNTNSNRRLFIKLAATAIIFSMLSLIDIWVTNNHLPSVKHIKSILQTSAITLLIFGLYRYFIEKSREGDIDADE